MAVFDFTFVVEANPHADDFEDRFIDAGCDDATFLILRGDIAISFDRASSNYKDAVFSAYEQITSTGATILRFEPDYWVSAAEIAERSGLTRQAISLYSKGTRREGFPSPSAKPLSSQPMWDWVDVSKWLVDQDMLDWTAYKEALISRAVNFSAQSKRIDPSCGFDIKSALGAL